MYLLAFVCLALLEVFGVQAQGLSRNQVLPKFFKRCSAQDPNINQCLKESINDSLRYLRNGIKHLKVPRLDPLSLKRLLINSNGGSVQSDIQLLNVKIFGISNGIIDDVKYQTNGKDVEIAIYATISKDIICESDYKMKARILQVGIFGDGKARIIFKNTRVLAKVKFVEKTEPDGAKYLEVRNVTTEIKPSSATFDFQNLFNGDKELGVSMNKFINENWEIIIEETRPAIQQGISLALQLITKQIFYHVPIKNIYL